MELGCGAAALRLGATIPNPFRDVLACLLWLCLCISRRHSARVADKMKPVCEQITSAKSTDSQPNKDTSQIKRAGKYTHSSPQSVCKRNDIKKVVLNASNE